MVCDRCIMAVRDRLEKLDFVVNEISLGTVLISPEPDSPQLQNISTELESLGFELIDNEREKLADRIKTAIIELVHYSDLSSLNSSIISVLAKTLNKDDAYLSRLFSDVQGITIEKYIIQQKIEKIKELLEYGQLNINEIALQMGYSSAAHLSAQFKSITGTTPSKYKITAQPQRRALDR